jgi:uncharacterized membrane protein
MGVCQTSPNGKIQREITKKKGRTMAEDKTVHVIIGQYGSVEEASQDLDYILQEREEHLIATFDGAVVAKDESGQVRIVRKHETAVRFGAWGGAVVGGIVGLAFPPLLLEMGAAGAVAGAVVGHLWQGMSRSDVHEMGEALEKDTAALIIAVDSESADAARSSMGRARSLTECEVAARAADIDQAIADAAVV